MSENLVDVPEAQQRIALQEIIREIFPSFKAVGYEALAFTFERMLLKRGFKIVPETQTEKDERGLKP